MALIENLSTELRSWFFPVLRQLSHKEERHDPDPLPTAAGPLTIGRPRVGQSRVLDRSTCAQQERVARGKTHPCANIARKEAPSPFENKPAAGNLEM